MEELSELPRPSSQGIRRVVVVVPSFFTLVNLFFGFWSIVSAYRGNFKIAGFFVVFAAVLDVVDGRIARLSNTSTRFGAELDSLVDVISFGIAPAMLMYFLEFASTGKFGWVVCYLYVVAAALRLARYNVIAHGKPHSNWFTGLPSPAAAMTIAMYYPFSQTSWYQASLAYLDLDHEGLAVLTLLAAALMVSNIKYPRLPRIGVRSLSGILGIVVYIGILLGAVLAPSQFFFPLGLFYMLFGIVRSTTLSLIDRGSPPTREESTPGSRPLTIHRTREGR